MLTSESNLAEAAASAPIRAFLAIQPPEDIRYELAAHALVGEVDAADATDGIDTIDALLDSQPLLRRVPKDNIHLTLRFLGAVSLEKIEALTSRMDQLGKGAGRIPVKLDAVTVFPARNPRVVAAEIAPNRDLEELAGHVNSIVTGVGIDVDRRPFRPHITLARVRRGSLPLPDLHIPLDLRFTAFEVVLFRSSLGRDGATYSRIHATRLGE